MKLGVSAILLVSTLAIAMTGLSPASPATAGRSATRSASVDADHVEYDLQSSVWEVRFPGGSMKFGSAAKKCEGTIDKSGGLAFTRVDTDGQKLVVAYFPAGSWSSVVDANRS